MCRNDDFLSVLMLATGSGDSPEIQVRLWVRASYYNQQLVICSSKHGGKFAMGLSALHKCQNNSEMSSLSDPRFQLSKNDDWRRWQEARLAVIESEVLTTARINVMKIAGRILVKAFRTAGKQLAARRKQESEDNEIREQIINNKTASRPWLDVIVQKMKLAPKLKSRLQGIATKVKTKIKMDRVFETQATRQRQRPSVIVKAAEEGESQFLRELLVFRRSHGTDCDANQVVDDHSRLRHKIHASLRRQVSVEMLCGFVNGYSYELNRPDKDEEPSKSLEPISGDLLRPKIDSMKTSCARDPRA